MTLDSAYLRGSIADVFSVLQHSAHPDQPLNYARIYLADLFPSTVRRIIYFESDLTIVDDVAKLWNINIRSRVLVSLHLSISCRRTPSSTPGNYLDFDSYEYVKPVENPNSAKRSSCRDAELDGSVKKLSDPYVIVKSPEKNWILRLHGNPYGSTYLRSLC